MINLDSYNKGVSPYNSATLIKYNEGDVSLEGDIPSIKQSSTDRQHTLLEGETLQNVAYQYYGDSGLWYIIAEANNILNAFEELEAGRILTIPVDG